MTQAQRRYDICCIREKQNAQHLAYAIQSWRLTHGEKRAGKRLTVAAWIADWRMAHEAVAEAWRDLCREAPATPNATTRAAMEEARAMRKEAA